MLVAGSYQGEKLSEQLAGRWAEGMTLLHQLDPGSEGREEQGRARFGVSPARQHPCIMRQARLQTDSDAGDFQGSFLPRRTHM